MTLIASGSCLESFTSPEFASYTNTQIIISSDSGVVFGWLGLTPLSVVTRLERSSQGFLEPHTSSADNRLVDLKGLIAADDRCIGEIASFEQLQVAGPQVGVLELKACHNWGKEAAMRRLVLDVAVM